MNLMLPEDFKKVIHYFQRLPGVGEKTALRQSLFMANWSKEDLVHFSECLKSLSALVNCETCGMIKGNEEICPLCAQEKLGESPILLVVESVTDCMAIGQISEAGIGAFHILHGVLNPLIGIGPEELKLDKLIARIKENNIKEVILALNPSVEGDATCSYLKGLIPSDVLVKRIGLGIPVGGNLEYLDGQTIGIAIENRRSF